MNLLFTICARAGSKGLKSKNSREFVQYPLSYYTISAFALFYKQFEDKYAVMDLAINSDSEELIGQVKRLNTPCHIIKRKEELSGDMVAKPAVIKDTLKIMSEKTGIQYDIVVDLDITSPLRKVIDIKEVLDSLISNVGADVAFSVTDARRLPYFNMVSKDSQGYMHTVIKSEFVTRQEAPECFDMNASIYAYRRNYLEKSEVLRIFDGKAVAWIMEDTGVLDIDSNKDLKLMEVIAQYLYKTEKDYAQVRDGIVDLIDLEVTNSSVITDYWEKYLDYWDDKVDVANLGQENNNHKIVSDTIIKKWFIKMDVKEVDVFLDFGCGSCRLFPYYRTAIKKDGLYYGVDIAQSPLVRAVDKFPQLKGYLKKTDGSSIPYESKNFDKVICFGVFDACYQNIILDEIIRVLKENGEALITGKNSRYCLDDDEAMTAEINARRKKHPNYFTNVKSLIDQLIERKVIIKEKYFFLYRGDFADNKYLCDMPDRFYEWAIIIKKQKDTKNDKYLDFSGEYSETFKYLKGAN